MGVRHKCRARGCEREARARHLCIKHYAQIRRHGRLQTSNHREICLVNGCGTKHFARGYCQKHYRQLVRTGKIVSTNEVAKDTCCIATCNKKKVGRGLCNTHHRFYLFKFVHRGKTWADVDRIIADLNQNFLALRNRVDIIRERHRILINAKNAYFKKQLLRDLAEESLLGPTDLAGDLEDLDALVDSGEETEPRYEGDWDEFDNFR